MPICNTCQHWTYTGDNHGVCSACDMPELRHKDSYCPLYEDKATKFIQEWLLPCLKMQREVDSFLQQFEAATGVPVAIAPKRDGGKR